MTPNGAKLKLRMAFDLIVDRGDNHVTMTGMNNTDGMMIASELGWQAFQEIRRGQTHSTSRNRRRNATQPMDFERFNQRNPLQQAIERQTERNR